MSKKYPEVMMRSFGVKSAVDINFVNPKKILIRLDGGEEVKENVTFLTVIEGPGTSSIEINYKTTEGEGSISSACSNFKEILILD